MLIGEKALWLGRNLLHLSPYDITLDLAIFIIQPKPAHRLHAGEEAKRKVETEDLREVRATSEALNAMRACAYSGQ